MAAVPYPLNGGQNHHNRSAAGRRSAGRANRTHLRLVEQPLFVEPIFDELTSEALAALAPKALWSEPEVQLPRQQIISELSAGHLMLDRQLSTCVGPGALQLTDPAKLTNQFVDGFVSPVVAGKMLDRTAVRSRLRYRVRRLFVGIVVGAALYGAVSGASALASSHQGSPVVIAGSVRVQGGYEYTVRAGDTLWSIASRVYPNGDPRPLQAQLSAELSGKSPQPGEHLILP